MSLISSYTTVMLWMNWNKRLAKFGGPTKWIMGNAQMAKENSVSVLHEFTVDSDSVIFVVRDDGTTRSTHKKPKEDTFGQNDEDWMVYRSIVSLEFVWLVVALIKGRMGLYLLVVFDNFVNITPYAALSMT